MLFRILFAVAVVIVVVLLLWPQHVDGVIPLFVNSLPISWQARVQLIDVLQAVGNVLLFVPIGFFASLWLRRWWAGLAIGFAISAVCELAQRLLPGRTSDFWDVVWNTVGAAFGVGILVLLGCRYAQIRMASRSAPK